MTDNTATVINQLRVVLDLTHTEIQVAETRITQARTEAVRRELSPFSFPSFIMHG